MNGEKYKKLAIIVLVLIIGSVVSLTYILNYKIDSKSTSNSTVQSVKNDKMNNLNEPEQNSPLFKKNILFLGSSVTYGSAANGVSFVDMIAKETGANVIKNATSGTTLVEIDELSYVSRLKKFDKEKEIDLLVTQLSTNDAEKELELGEMIESFDINDFDTQTIAGSIEYIIAYGKKTWNCPIIFYTSPQYQSDRYPLLIDLLTEISVKWNIEVIDLWNNPTFTDLTEEQKQLYFADEIHPTKEGYMELWTPVIKEGIERIISE